MVSHNSIHHKPQFCTNPDIRTGTTDAHCSGLVIPIFGGVRGQSHGHWTLAKSTLRGKQGMEGGFRKGGREWGT